MRSRNDSQHSARNALLRESKDRSFASVTSSATRLGIRALAGGGQVFPRHGLISPSVLPTASLFVDPVEVPRLIAALHADGWRVQRHPYPFRLLPRAITTLIHPAFANVLNLHSVIPGFFGDPQTTFEVLWDRRRSMVMDGASVPILDKLSTVIFAAHERIYGQRWSAVSGTHIDFFLEQFRTALTPAECRELGKLVEELGAVDELRLLLEGLGLTPGAWIMPSEPYVRVRLGLEHVTRADVWVVAFLEWPPDRRGALLRRAFPRSAVAVLRTLPGLVASFFRTVRASNRVAAWEQSGR